jgi:hypothetical protein
MNNVDNNYFGDANSLVHGCFPQMEDLEVYYDGTWEKEKNKSNDQCFPAKMQAASLQCLCTSSAM